MKFLIQIPQLIYGGAEKVLVNFANVLVENGHQVEILETYEKGFLKEDFDKRVTFNAICSNEYSRRYYASLTEIKNEKKFGQKIVKCAKLLFSKVVGYRKYAEKLCVKYYADKEFDVAINYLETDSPAFLLENIKAKKYIQWIHTDVGNMENPDELNRYLPLYEKMDMMFCVAESAKINFISKYPGLKDKTHVMYNFFDYDYVRKCSEEPFEYTSVKPVLLSVGRMTAPKQYLRFLNVLKRLKDEGEIFSWHVLGTGIEEAAIKKRVQELELQDCVYLDGVTDNPYKYMKNCDLFVLPSGWEGFPTVTIEAKMLECPVLATDVSGIREQLVHGETGWIVENTEAAIYQGIKLLLNDVFLRQGIKCNSRIEKIWDNDIKYKMFMSILG